MADEERFDVIILGTGAAGEAVGHYLGSAGMNVVTLERERVQGECGYWACNPSKVLLRPVSLWGESVKCFGVKPVELDWQAISDYRDEAVRHYDDSMLAERLRQKGVTLVRSEGRLSGPGTVVAGDRKFTAPHIVLATGSEPVIPPIEGLKETGYWTNRETVSATRVPRSLVFIGGGPVSIELGQMMRRYGAEVTVIERAERLFGNEEDELGQHALRALQADGIDVRLSVEAKKVSKDGDSKAVELSDGSVSTAEEVVVAVGRRPRTGDIGLDTIGIEASRGVLIDDYGRAADGIWAIGDVVGPPFFTHRSLYHARCVAANILDGPSRVLDERALPRVTFVDPEIAAVGLTEKLAREQGFDVRSATLPMEELDRPYTYQTDWSGLCKLVVQRESGEILGAAAVGPLSSEWIHIASVAIKARLPYEMLGDVIFQFPTFSEFFWHLSEKLDAE